MERLSREYALLFNGVTDAIKSLEKTVHGLKQLQQRAEDMYLQQALEAGAAEAGTPSAEAPPAAEGEGGD